MLNIINASFIYLGHQMKTLNLLKKPSAFLPIAMSLSALALVIIHIALTGTAPQPDEGMETHMWQFLMALQIPVIVFFAIKWLPQTPKQAIIIIAFQVGAAVAALLPVFVLGW
jgi:membrane-associated HD superfamily phosphohydrolase